MTAVATAVLFVSAAAIANNEHSFDRIQAPEPQVILAQYLRAVPAGPTDAHHCVRVCVREKSMGDKAPPVCVEWKRFC